jgi:hypothetical protein
VVNWQNIKAVTQKNQYTNQAPKGSDKNDKKSKYLVKKSQFDTSPLAHIIKNSPICPSSWGGTKFAFIYTTASF